MSNESKCPFSGVRTTAGASANARWWPDQLNVKLLHQHSPLSNPMGQAFDYAEEFKRLDLDAVIKDLHALMTTSQDWWPADYGHYGPLFIRMAWHSAGTYRIADGRGGGGSGGQRFGPLNSWPDNANLDKARRLLWPVKQKYGRKLSWADLMILAGNVALESMGFKTFGFAGGREDIWEPEEDIFWGPEGKWLADERYSGDRELANPLAAVQMGLIYVNPEGPNGQPDPLAAARDIRETFARMAMNDEETVALIAGGHTFGKTHGAADPSKYVGREPEGAAIEQQGFGWQNSYGSGNGAHTITSGSGGRMDHDPDEVEQQLLRQPVRLRLGAHEEPGRCSPVDAQGRSGSGHRAGCPRSIEEARSDDAHDGPRPEGGPELREDLEALPRGPEGLRRRVRPGLVQADPPRHGAGVALPGPARPRRRRCCGRTRFLRWIIELIDDHDIAALKAKITASGLSISQLVTTAWASAATFRGSDKRGGANGARLRLAPQKDWEVNQPAELAKVLQTLEAIQKEFNGAQSGGKKVSLADLIVLGGCAAVEEAAKKAGHDVKVPFSPGRMDASSAQTDVHSFAVLEPAADGFRNYVRAGSEGSAAELLIDRANLLTLTAPEMTVLIGGMRVLNANLRQSAHGVFTRRPGALTNDFFVNLLDMTTRWQTVRHLRGRAGGARSGDRPDQVDGHRRRSRLRLELPAPSPRGGLCLQRLAAGVRAGLRGGLDQGDEPRSLRPRVRSTEWTGTVLGT